MSMDIEDCYPLPTKKKKVKHQAIAVCLLYRSRKSDKGEPVEEYLQVKRPAVGLLAGQWEFPTVAIDDEKQEAGETGEETEEGEGDSHLKKKTLLFNPDYSLRKQRMDTLLREILPEKDGHGQLSIAASSRRHLGECTHVFSHVTHTMFVETAQLALVDGAPAALLDAASLRWVDKALLLNRQVPLTTGVLKAFELSKEVPSREVAKVAE